VVAWVVVREPVPVVQEQEPVVREPVLVALVVQEPVLVV
jgi:hypothetical protein